MLNKISYRILLFLFVFAFAVVLLEPFTTFTFVEPFSVILLTIALFSLLRMLFLKLSKLSPETLKKIIFCILFLFIFLQILWAFLGNISFSGDPWHIITQATRLSKGDTSWNLWLQSYPNLLALTSLCLGMIHFSNLVHLDFYVIFYSFNILVNTAIWGVVLKFLWCKRPSLSAFTAFLILITPMSYGFLIKVGYSDGVAILSLVLLLTIFDSAYEKKKFSFWSFILTTIVFLLAYLARPNVVVFIIALIIISIYAYLDRGNTKLLWKSCLKMVIACFIGILLASASLKGLAKATNYDLENKNVLPTAHWIYMGLNAQSRGQYSREDFQYSLNHEGYETAKEADIIGIKQRLENQNLKLPFFCLQNL